MASHHWDATDPQLLVCLAKPDNQGRRQSEGKKVRSGEGGRGGGGGRGRGGEWKGWEEKKGKRV